MIKLEPQVLTLEIAKKILEENGIKRPLNNNVLLMNTIAPMATKNGIILGEKAHKEAQQQVNKAGMMVVGSPHKESHFDNISIPDDVVFEGDRVLFGENSMVSFTRTLRSKDLLDGLELKEGEEPKLEHYKCYALVCIHSNSLSCQLD